MRKLYSQTTKDKTKDHRTLDQIQEAYENGILEAPCIQLDYVEYDERLAQKLRIAVDAIPSVVGKRKRQN